MLRLFMLRLTESYFRHRWLYLLPIVIMLIAAGASIYLAKPEYTAQGVLRVQKESLLAKLTSVKGTDFSWQTPASITVGELNELLRTDAFVRAAIQETDFEAEMAGGAKAVNDTIKKVRKAVWVVSDGDNQVRIGAVNQEPRLALQMANGIIKTFLRWKVTGDQSESQAAHTFFVDIILRYKTEVDSARQNLYDYLAAHPEPLKGNRPTIEQLEVSRLQNELDLAQTRYASALDKDENALLASAQAEGDVQQSYVLIDAPRMPEQSETSLKQIAIQVAIFAAVGVLLSALGIIGSALLDRSFRFPIDVWHGIQLPVLASVPKITPAKAKRRKRSKQSNETQSADREVEAVPMGGFVNAAETLSAPPNSTQTPEGEKIRRGKQSKNPGLVLTSTQPIDVALEEPEIVQLGTDISTGYNRNEGRK